MAHDPAPLILTLALDQASQAHFDRLRTAHFPAERLVVGAHVTLFHALPADVAMEPIEREAAATGPFQVQVSDVRFLGKGVALGLRSVRLKELRARLRQDWQQRLTRQDQQSWQPHVTIQNKVAPDVARALHRQMSDAFEGYDVLATGLAVWVYRNGPWEAAGMFPFMGTD